MALQTAGDAPVPPGAVITDAPLTGANGDTWLIREVQGQFTLVGFGDRALPQIDGIARIGINSRGDYPCFDATDGHAIRRYGNAHIYLFRPDGHVCAVFTTPDAAAITAAMKNAMGAAL